MIKFLQLASLGLLAFTLTVSGDETGNLLSNSSFEDGPWPAFKYSEVDTTGENAHSGECSMLLYNRSGTDDWSPFRFVVRDLTPLLTYRFSFYAKGSPYSRLKAKIHCHVPGEPDMVTKLERSFVGEEFEYFEIVIELPPESTTANLVIENWNTGEDVWLDDVFFGPQD
jgi:hypothetical protein